MKNLKFTSNLHKAAICSTYDRNANSYSHRNKMQCGTLKKLLNYSKFYDIEIYGRVLDVGCGLGTAKQYLDDYGVNNIDYTGIDISQGMLDIANNLTSESCRFIKADAETLPFDDSLFNLIISNSAYHWLNIPEIGITPKKAWQEANRVLKPGEYLIFSISGENTAKVFQECYAEVTAEYSKTTVFNQNLYRRDPIGSMRLSEVERILFEVGFQIVFSVNDYEPVEFNSPSEYVEAVAAYGYEIYLSPFDDAVKKKIWKMISERFVRYAGNGSYVHDQFIIYIIAKKII